MNTRAYYLINSLTLYRLIISPWLVILAVMEQYDVFKWMIALSFATDAVDGALSRKYKVAGIEGAHLDSVADDATFIAAITGFVLLNPDFLLQQSAILFVLFSLLSVEVGLAFWKYRKISVFHTHLAKLAAVLQGVFFMSFFFLERPLYLLFYAAVVVTALELIEEIILVFAIPEWQANVKGIYWWMRKRKGKSVF